MNALMYDIGTPIPGQQLAREVCVVFRPVEQTDTQFIKIQYGNGCSASVSEIHSKDLFVVWIYFI